MKMREDEGDGEGGLQKHRNSPHSRENPYTLLEMKALLAELQGMWQIWYRFAGGTLVKSGQSPKKGVQHVNISVCYVLLRYVTFFVLWYASCCQSVSPYDMPERNQNSLSNSYTYKARQFGIMSTQSRACSVQCTRTALYRSWSH